MKLLRSSALRAIFSILLILVSAKIFAGTFYPDFYPNATVYSVTASEISLSTSTSNSTDGTFTLTLTGSYVSSWPIWPYECYYDGWDYSCSLNLYGLEVSLDNGASWNVVPGSSAPSFWTGGTSHTFTGIGSGTYQYRAVEIYYESYGNSVWDQVYYSPTHLQVTVQSGVPGTPLAPATLTVPSTANVPSVQISWTASPSSSAVEYRLEQQKNNGGYVEIYRGSAAVTSAIVTGLTNGTYDFRVLACDAISNCSFPTTNTGLVVNQPALENWGTYPIYHDFQAVEQSNGTHIVSWDLVGYVDYGAGSHWDFSNWSDWWLSGWYSEMHLQRSTDGGTTWETVYSHISASPSPITSWYDSSPAAGQTKYRMYWYWLQNGYGYEKYYSPVVAITSAAPTPPSNSPYYIYSGYYNSDTYLDFFIKVNALVGQDITSDFLLIQNPVTGKFTLDTNTSQIQITPNDFSHAKVELFDFNSDGLKDILIHNLASEVSGADNQIVFASGSGGGIQSAVLSLDEEMKKFSGELVSWVQNPSYFEENAGTNFTLNTVWSHWSNNAQIDLIAQYICFFTYDVCNVYEGYLVGAVAAGFVLPGTEVVFCATLLAEYGGNCLDYGYYIRGKNFVSEPDYGVFNQNAYAIAETLTDIWNGTISGTVGINNVKAILNAVLGVGIGNVGFGEQLPGGIGGPYDQDILNVLARLLFPSFNAETIDDQIQSVSQVQIRASVLPFFVPQTIFSTGNFVFHASIHGTSGGLFGELEWRSAFPSDLATTTTVGGILDARDEWPSDAFFWTLPVGTVYGTFGQNPAQLWEQIKTEVTDYRLGGGVTYCAIPELNRHIHPTAICDGYNSNSFIRGLLSVTGSYYIQSAISFFYGLDFYSFEDFPGTDKPVPNSDF